MQKGTGSWLARAWKSLRANPKHSWMLVLLVGVIMLASGQLVRSSWEQKQSVAKIAKIEAGDLKQLGGWLETNNIKSVTSYQLPQEGWMRPDAKEVRVFEALNGARVSFVWDENMRTLWGSEAFQERWVKAMLARPIETKQGFDATGFNKTVRAFGGAMMTVMIILIALFVFQRFMVGRSMGKSFAVQRLDPNTTFDSVIGYEEVKREFHEILEQMRHAQRFKDKGVKAPKGVLLTGDPGVGKTMLAKALANEIGAGFMYASGSDFVEMYVGVGASRVRSLFEKARKMPLAVIFIDEMDAIGSRSSGGNQDSERRSTINQLLAEMDGINENGQVLIVGATNYPDHLDPALLRPGRFDKKIHVSKPDVATRRAMLGRFVGDHAVPHLDLEAISLRTTGFSGAQLSNLVDEAKNLSLRRSGGQTVELDNAVLDQAMEVILMGIGERHSTPEERYRVAIHELGHALVGHLLCQRHAVVEKVSALGRGGALGFTLQRPAGERNVHTQGEMLGQVAMILGGRAAEEVVLHEISSGALDDLSRANKLTKEMVCELGMGSQVGLRTHDLSTTLPKEAEEDVRAILGAQYELAKKIIAANSEWMETMGRRLVDVDNLDHDDLFKGNEFRYE